MVDIDQYLDANKLNDSKDLKIACYGLIFKADIDDLQESLSVFIARKILGSSKKLV